MKALWILAGVARILSALLPFWIELLTAGATSSEKPNLRIHPAYPCYLQQPDGKPAVLIGDYTWGTFSDVDYDYVAMFDSLQAHGLNFARVWLWWGCEQFPGLTDRHMVMMDRRFVVPYQRIGPGVAQDGQPKYDLSRFNPAFFDRLRKLCQAARVRDIHLQLILFDAWMLKHPHLWKLQAFHRDNNVNGVDGDPGNTGTGTDGRRGFCSLGNAKALEAQQAFIRRVVDAVNECDNVLFEIANENFYNEQWELRLCDFIHDYEKTKPKRHLVMPKDLPNHKGVVQTWDPRRIHAALLEKRSLRQPLIFDTDWEINPNDDEVRRAMWAAVLSGGHFNYMDDSRQIGSEHNGDYRGTRRASLHRQIGYLAAFMRQIRFWEMQLDDALVKAGNAFAMASTNELAAYLPTGGNVTLDLSKLTGQLEVRWFDPKEGAWGKEVTLQGGRPEEFTAPNDNDWALFLRNYTGFKGSGPPARVQATAYAPSSVRVIWAASTADVGAVGYRILRDGTPIGTSVLPSYTDWGLEPQKSYAYTVVAFDLCGNSSAPSAPPARSTTPARAKFCQVRLGAEDVAERLKHVTDPDGDTRATTAGGRDCREPASAQDHYFYFAIDDGYLHNEDSLTTRLELSYFDESGFIEPQYDSVTGAYTNAKRIQLTGTRQWKTATWMLAQCRFANRQNAGADFRLFVGENCVKIRWIKLSVDEQGRARARLPRASAGCRQTIHGKVVGS
jgi:hypothetical protein